MSMRGGQLQCLFFSAAESQAQSRNHKTHELYRRFCFPSTATLNYTTQRMPMIFFFFFAFTLDHYSLQIPPPIEAFLSVLTPSTCLFILLFFVTLIRFYTSLNLCSKCRIFGAKNCWLR